MHKPVVLALWWLKQEDNELDISLDYIVRLCRKNSNVKREGGNKSKDSTTRRKPGSRDSRVATSWMLMGNLETEDEINIQIEYLKKVRHVIDNSDLQSLKD